MAKESKTAKPKRPYPRITLEKCLIVGRKIRELNGGNPWSPEEVSKAIGIAKTRNDFAYYLGSSREFGITNGTRNSEVISIEPLGRDIIYAENETVEKDRKIKAFLSVPLFQQVYEHYKGSELPEMTYLRNTLESKFNLNPDFHEEFRKVFIQNCVELGIDENYTPAAAEAEQEIEQIELTNPKQKTGKQKKSENRIFIAIPFSEKNLDRPEGFFNEVLKSLIKPAVEEAGFEAHTANIKGSDIIHSTIINELIDADLVIADLTDHNPNVLFELGVRMALDKPVVIIKAKGTGSIFDVDNMMRYFEYNPVLWASTLKSDIPDLTEHIKAAWNNKNKGQSYMKILSKQKA